MGEVNVYSSLNLFDILVCYMNLALLIKNFQDTKAKLAQANSKLEEMKEEGEQIRLACQEMIKKYQVVF